MIILELGLKPLCCNTFTYSFEASITIARTNATKYKPPAMIANRAVKPKITPVINLVTLLLKFIILS